MQRRDEFWNRQAFACGDLLKDIAEHLFEPDAGTLSIEPNRTSFIDVTVRILVGKQMAHASLPFLLV
jgi:hypothetical protein